jgi:hypothetical protein
MQEDAEGTFPASGPPPQATAPDSYAAAPQFNAYSQQQPPPQQQQQQQQQWAPPPGGPGAMPPAMGAPPPSQTQGGPPGWGGPPGMGGPPPGGPPMGWGAPPGGGPPGYGAPPQGRPPQPSHPAVIPPHPILFLENLPEDATTEQISAVFAAVLFALPFYFLFLSVVFAPVFSFWEQLRLSAHTRADACVHLSMLNVPCTPNRVVKSAATQACCYSLTQSLTHSLSLSIYRSIYLSLSLSISILHTHTHKHTLHAYMYLPTREQICRTRIR